MAFDFKKEYKEFYMPKNKPEIVLVPKANYIAVRGKGNPNEEDGAYKKDVGGIVCRCVHAENERAGRLRNGGLFRAMYDELPEPKKRSRK